MTQIRRSTDGSPATITDGEGNALQAGATVIWHAELLAGGSQVHGRLGSVLWIEGADCYVDLQGELGTTCGMTVFPQADGTFDCRLATQVNG